MDLSQQELPLTTYFSRGSKEPKSRASQYKNNKSSEDPQSVARSSKRRRCDARCSTASPLGGSVGQFKSRPKAPQLPTPATSARKHTRNERLKVQAETGLTSTSALLSSVGRKASEVITQLDSEPTLSKMSRPSREDAELSGVPLATPPTGCRRPAKPIHVEFPGPQQSNYAEAGLPTPRTLSRRTPEPMRGVDGHSFLARSNCRLPIEPSTECAVSHAVLPHVHHPTRPSADLPCSPVDSSCPTPFCATGKGFVPQQLDGASVPPKQYSFLSKTPDSQLLDRHAVPMFPVPSSQSQYLLHLDATPKRKRCSQSIERVISSQTQEERELTLSMPLRPVTITSSSGVSLGKHMKYAPIPPTTRSEQKPHHVYTLGSSPVRSPISSPSGSSHPLFAMKKALDAHPSESSSPSRRERSTPCYTPCRNAKTYRKSPRLNPIGNIPSAHIEDSFTESESESDILQMLRTAKLRTTLNPASREMNQVPSHSSMACGMCPPSRRECVEGGVPGGEDDSATEAESDTEILHCVAEISKNRLRDDCPEASRKDTSPPPIVSPLVSPARPRIAAAPLVMRSTQFVAREDARSSVPGPCASYRASIEQPRIPSESLPSAVLEFIRMFPGDESYPADFPESLRV